MFNAIPTNIAHGLNHGLCKGNIILIQNKKC
jgi:hypothetical protein